MMQGICIPFLALWPGSRGMDLDPAGWEAAGGEDGGGGWGTVSVQFNTVYTCYKTIFAI